MMKPAVCAGSLCVVLAATAAAAQVPAGPEFQVNTYTTGTQYSPRLAMQPGGDFIVAWDTEGMDGSSTAAVGQRYGASGVPRGAEFQINTYTTGSQHQPVMSVGRKGDLVVVWTSDEDGSGTSIVGARFDAAGGPLGAEFAVNTYTTSYQNQARVGRAADGRFIVLWTSNVLDGSNSGIAARRYDASGTPLGDQFVVNTYTTGGQGSGDLAVDAGGNFVAVWETFYLDGSGTAIAGQRFDSAGGRLGGEFVVNTFTTNNQIAPTVRFSPAGGFVVAWSSRGGDGDHYGVAARRYDAAGAPIGSEFAVNTYTTGEQYGIQIAHDDEGNFIVAWTSADQDGALYGVFAKRFFGAGGPRGPEFQVNTYTTDRQFRPMVASDAVGNFVIAWIGDSQDGSGTGVIAQRFGGLSPAALVVDGAPGNSVWEPGETVPVRPSWRNLNGAAQTVSATLSAITGPAGATYAIPDGAGGYGTVADGATAPCLDCYAVSVSNPPVRPALHWDASALEAILPDTQGQQKRWSLHIGASFTDVPAASPFYRFVETLLHHAVTGGCGATEYCPASTTTRDQMAVFVLVAKEGAGYAPPACTTPVFLDVPAASPFCRWIEELARRGVVSGCGAGNYCPAAPVTREQMAVFVLRTLDATLSPPACAAPLYADVPATSAFCRWIEELTRRGVVSGCGGGNYCPQSGVTREQMGVFLGVTFGLVLYGP